MKKIYLLLVLLFTGLQSVFAQFIWHPDLGTPYAGAISLPWDTRSYMFQVDNGEEFGSPGDIWDALDAQLRAAGITWIRVNSVENPADGTFEVWFDLDENKDNMSRSIHMGYSYSAYFIITQLKQDQEHFEGLYADLPANRKFEVLPGEEISIQLHGLSAGTSYDVYQYYSENDIDIFDTFFSNTGGDYLYTSAFPEGDFGFSFSNSQFNVSYPEAYRNHYSFDTRALAFPAEGDVMRVYFDSYSKWNGMKVAINSLADLSFLDRVVQDHNTGKIASWNPRMRLSYGYDTQLRQAYFEIACPPNLTDEFIQSTLGIMNASGWNATVSQDFGGSVRTVPVSYEYDKETSQIIAIVEYTQPFVTYTLYRENSYLQSLTGNGGSLRLSTPATSGYYRIVATYSEGGLSDSAELEGIRYNSDMLSLNDDRNWILTRTFNCDNHGDTEEEQISYDVSYYDGLGYALQNVQICANGDGQGDIIQPFVYDGLYREELQYLPYTLDANNGQSDDAALANQEEFYKTRYGLATDPHACVRTEYEPSALNRVLRTHKPGAEYQSDTRSMQTFYMGNAVSTVLRLRVDPDDRSLTADGYYAANELSGTRSTNEDGAVVITYADKEGRTVYENRQLRNGSATENIITYYAYDDCGRLAWVMTPKGSDRGIKKMFNEQWRRHFPMPDYEIDAAKKKVVVRIYGNEINKRYTDLLKTDNTLSLWDCISLDAVQKGRFIHEDVAKDLLNRGLIEGDAPNYTISLGVAKATRQLQGYTKQKGLDKDKIKQMVLQYLKNAGSDGAKRDGIYEYIKDVMPQAKTREQQLRILGDILNALSVDKLIFANGRTWFLKE